MVTCDRCHRNFSSYTALSQHYETKHHGATKTLEIEKGVAAENELEKYRTTVHYTHSSSKAKLTAFLLLLIIAAGVIGYVALSPQGGAQHPANRPGTGSIAPDFTLPNTAGGTFTLSGYRGKSNVLLLFNEGLACQPCVNQMNDLDQINQQFAGLNVIVVSITTDPLSLLSDWARTSGPRYGIVSSDQNLQVSKVYDVLGPDTSMMPGTKPGHTFILVDTSGVIKWRQDYGPNTMYVPNSQIIAAVRQALGA